MTSKPINLSVPQVAPFRPRWTSWVFILSMGWTGAYALHTLVAPHFQERGVFDQRIQVLLLLAAAGLTLIRARRYRAARLAWSLIGVGILAWALGVVYYSLALSDLSHIPIPSPADAGYLAFPVLTFTGLLLLARPNVRGVGVSWWADGLGAALAVGAILAAIVLDRVANRASGGPASVITELAYPISDLVLLGTCLTVVAVRGWRADRTWTLLALGVCSFWVADSHFALGNTGGTYSSGGVFDAGWWIGLLLIARAAWEPTSTPRSVQRERDWMIAPPVCFAALAAGVLAYGSLRPHAVNAWPVALALASLAAVGLRLVLTFRSSLSLFAVVRDESITDALTGLPNRRALTRDLEEHASSARDGRAAVLALYDLDGFKHYNDAFGHQAGDALLTRLGGALTATVGQAGRAYRMGGDEFCVLVARSTSEAFNLLSAAAEALSDHGEGFSVTSSWGAVSLPEETSSPEAALRLADQRMYAQKQGGRPTASRQSTDVLLRALAERDPELDGHVHDVAMLAGLTAGRLGLQGADLEQVRLAAELHDIGKVAIPDQILTKAGPLDEHEWEYMRRHSVIGERILAAAPSLQKVAQIVRSSHERFDGGGYPDGLSGPKVPLGSRIVSVCDAYDAMVSARPYSASVSSEAATSELRRCAGTQFDPVVVTAFIGALASAELPPRSPAAKRQRASIA